GVQRHGLFLLPGLCRVQGLRERGTHHPHSRHYCRQRGGLPGRGPEPPAPQPDQLLHRVPGRHRPAPRPPGAALLGLLPALLPVELRQGLLQHLHQPGRDAVHGLHPQPLHDQPRPLLRRHGPPALPRAGHPGPGGRLPGLDLGRLHHPVLPVHPPGVEQQRRGQRGQPHPPALQSPGQPGVRPGGRAGHLLPAPAGHVHHLLPHLQDRPGAGQEDPSRRLLEGSHPPGAQSHGDAGHRDGGLHRLLVPLLHRVCLPGPERGRRRHKTFEAVGAGPLHETQPPAAHPGSRPEAGVQHPQVPAPSPIAGIRGRPPRGISGLAGPEAGPGRLRWDVRHILHKPPFPVMERQRETPFLFSQRPQSL
ncbi:hypothetical protein QTO34_016351, partial [Cnephaeus nilssonii]